jgi:hypothetical protein
MKEGAAFTGSNKRMRLAGANVPTDTGKEKRSIEEAARPNKKGRFR